MFLGNEEYRINMKMAFFSGQVVDYYIRLSSGFSSGLADSAKVATIRREFPHFASLPRYSTGQAIRDDNINIMGLVDVSLFVKNILLY